MAAARQNECTPSVIRAIQRIEDRSDKCYRELALLGLPWNHAAWAALTDSIRIVEASVPTNLYGSRHHINAATNVSMIAAQIYKFARQHGRGESLQLASFTWTPRLASNAHHAFEVAKGYLTFCTVFPYWHANMYAGELINETTVRFMSYASLLGRRITAYQQGIRSPHFKGGGENGMDTTPVLRELFMRSLWDAQQIGKYGVHFPHLHELQEALYEAHNSRTLAMMRHYPDMCLGDYTLDDFRRFYSAINAVAGAHEFLCYQWTLEHGLPIESLLLFKRRSEWVDLLGRLARLMDEQVYAMLKDVTFGRVYAVDFHLLPFVPLKVNKGVLALAPFCSLSANWEENLLRCISRRDSDLYSTHTLSKEDEMRRPLIALTSGTRLVTGPHRLPKGLPDIDLIVQDLEAKILIFCELKWNRKPNGQKERQERDKEVLKGFSQIDAIRSFVESNPKHLVDRRYIAWDISHFKRVHYCVVARDHMIEPPPDAAPIYSYGAFAAQLSENSSTANMLGFLEGLDWLPMEGTDFSVRFERHYAGGVAVDSEVYYPAGGPLAFAR